MLYYFLPLLSFQYYVFFLFFFFLFFPSLFLFLGVAAARALFAAKTSRGEDKIISPTNTTITVHNRVITGVFIDKKDKNTLTTSSLDGKIILWDLNTLGLTSNMVVLGI